MSVVQASEDVETVTPPVPTGEDAAYFDPEQQSRDKWIFFSAELAVVLAILYAVWQPIPYSTCCTSKCSVSP
jgi:hypothetical protein